MTAIYPSTMAAIRARAAALDGVHSEKLTQADWDRRWLLEYVDEQARIIRAAGADIRRIDAERTQAEREADQWKDRVTELETATTGGQGR